jgi:hypothetical protein
MIVVVRDALSDFVLYAERCDSESHENMRSGIISAAMFVFPGIPIRICLMHFLRDIGKDLLLDLHTDLGSKINRIGIKSSLKSMLKNMPDYDQKTLDQIENGFSSNREGIEIMCIRRILEQLTGSTGSSGYGFPFSMRHYSFYLACLRTERCLSDLSARITSGRSEEFISSIMKLIQKIRGSLSIRDIGGKPGSVNGLFQSLRKAFNIPDRGNTPVRFHMGIQMARYMRSAIS